MQKKNNKQNKFGEVMYIIISFCGSQLKNQLKETGKEM